MVSEVVDALTFEAAIDKVALVVAAVGPLVTSAAPLLAVSEDSSVSRAVLFPDLHPVPVLRIILPLTLIAVTYSVLEGTLTISSILRPITDVYVTIVVDQASISLPHTFLKHTFIH